MEAEQASNSFREIFDAAVELPVSEREEFLTSACGADVKLRAAVESLLNAHDRAGTFLADSLITLDLFQARERLSPGTRIGKYALIRVLGEGGHGTVYLAEQDPPLKRRVALKVIKPGMDTEQVVARFELERQALAMMDHPNIAKVFDAGSTASGYPYFVMELVEGWPITEFCQAGALDVEGRLKLFATVCAAVHHAHEKGIIHRDLKPGNVLVLMQDGTPMPKVIDFGIAKALLPAAEIKEARKDPVTAQAQFLGTPQYMSPEQANFAEGAVDWRSDVYSLGALLYELLTDSPPFDRAQLQLAGAGEIGRMLREVDPPYPSERLAGKEPIAPHLAAYGAEVRRRLPLVRGELDKIVMKAMEKDAGERYQSAAELAADVRRHLAGEPVRATKSPWIKRARRSLYRHRRSAAVAALLVIGALAGMAMRPWWPAAGLNVSPSAGVGSVLSFAEPSRELIDAMTGQCTSINHGVYELRDTDRIETKARFAPPIAFRIVARTDSTNIRIGYAANQIIFNWARNLDMLRVDGGPAGGRHKNGAGRIPVNEWVTIDVMVTKNALGISVNGRQRYRTEADFSKVDEPLAIFQGAGAVVMVKSVRAGIVK